MMDNSKRDQLYCVEIDWEKIKRKVAVCDDEHRLVNCLEARVSRAAQKTATSTRAKLTLVNTKLQGRLFPEGGA